MDEEEFYSRLKDEMVDWQRDGIIDSARAEAIMKRHDVEKKTYKPGNVITALSTLAVILIGVGVILFFASNWEYIPDLIKIVLLFTATFSSYYAGYVMRFEKQNYPRAGHALIFLGSILVGASIFLIGQIFNINVDAYWLVLLWFIAISPMGYVFDSRPSIGLNIITFTYWLVFSVSPEYRGMSSPLLLFLLFGIALYSIGQLHELTDKWARFRMTYKGFGIFFILISYFYFSIWPSEFRYIYNYPQQAGFSVTAQFLYVAFAIIAVISILANLMAKEKLRSIQYEFYLLLAAFIGWIVLFVINTYPQQFFTMRVEQYGTYFEISPSSEKMLFAVLSAFQIGLSIVTISIGYYKNEVDFVNMGIIFFALGVMQVYINHLQGMLPKGLGLIIGGIFLFFFATYLEKKRRNLLNAMKGVE
ncbi:MAG: DUF2157 domain-containing protein [Candidatus Methanoperedens sp.]|nr:DUF2157 domain-containing protein [Candidatus Methanoperedens sp.]